MVLSPKGLLSPPLKGEVPNEVRRRGSARRPASRNPIFREDCGGWRVSEILWYARVMGLNDTSIYSDGWIAWSDEGRPFVTGDPASK